jgi:hypothetical protein
MINKKNKLQNRPVLLIHPGPLHLFWTTGVYYLWSMKNKYDVVLIVYENYKNDNNFKKIINLPQILSVEYIQSLRFFARYDHVTTLCKKILKTFNPQRVLLSNIPFFDDQCLLFALLDLGRQVKIYHYQNCRIALNWSLDFKFRNNQAINLYYKKNIERLPFFNFVIKKLFIIIYFIKKFAGFYLYFRLIPFYKRRTIFRPLINLINGNVINGDAKWLHNNLKIKNLAYLDLEAVLPRSFGLRVNIINHPAKKFVKEVGNFIYDNINEEDQIVILPSANLEALIENGIDSGKIVSFIGKKWCEAIHELADHFKDFKIKIKLHPSSSPDLWHQVINLVNTKYNIELVDQSISAEYLIMKSRVVVGDVSSVLWWALLIGNKIIISLDTFGYEHGNEMRSYGSGINYVNEVSQIRKLNLPNPDIN